MPRKARIDAAGALHHIFVRGIEHKDVMRLDKQPQTVKARSLLCFWPRRELGMTTLDIAKRLKISQSAVSRCSLRGQNIAENNKFRPST